MSLVLKDGEYGLINGAVFTNVDFTKCVFKVKIPPIEVERKMFRCSEVKIATRDFVEDNGVKYKNGSVFLEYRESDYEISFALEVISGILYILEVDAKFLESF